MSEQPIRVEVHPADLIERHADERGRITLGSEYDDDRVRVAVLERVATESESGLWYCDHCETGVRSEERPEQCPECSAGGRWLSALDVRNTVSDQ